MSIQTISQTLLASLLSTAIAIPIVRAQQNPNKIPEEVVEITIPEGEEHIEVTGGEITEKCAFPDLRELPDEFVVYAVGGNGGKPLDFQIDQTGHMATQSNLIVNSPSKPVVLMLSAFEPNIWNIKWTEDTDIVAVVSSGYYRQEIAGLPRDTPVLTTTLDNGAKCGYFNLENNYQVLNPLSRKLFGQEVNKVYFSDWIGKPLEDDNPKLINSDDTTVDSFLAPDAPLSGMAGVKAAVEEGALRRATEADIKAWMELQRKLHPEKNLPPPTGYWYTDAYVVTDNFTYPNGVFGGDVTFLIPKDAPEPNGNPNDSTILNFKTGECSGLFCDERSALVAIVENAVIKNMFEDKVYEYTGI